MVTKKDLKNYEFPNMDRYFEYVLESIANGQRKQAKSLVSAMSQRQRNQFSMYLDNYQGQLADEAKKITFAEN